MEPWRRRPTIVLILTFPLFICLVQHSLAAVTPSTASTSCICDSPICTSQCSCSGGSLNWKRRWDGRQNNFRFVEHAPNIIIKSPNVTSWGTWGSMERCEGESYVIGFSLKVQAKQAQPTSIMQWQKDDTALNGVELVCSHMGPLDEKTRIKSKEGHWGSWQPIQYCPGEKERAVGFQLRSETDMGHKDDTAGNNLRLICEGGTILEGDGLDWGHWTDEQYCPRESYICGIKTQIESSDTPAQNADYSGLNNLEALCCRGTSVPCSCHCPAPAATTTARGSLAVMIPLAVTSLFMSWWFC